MAKAKEPKAVRPPHPLGEDGERATATVLAGRWEVHPDGTWLPKPDTPVTGDLRRIAVGPVTVYAGRETGGEQAWASRAWVAGGASVPWSGGHPSLKAAGLDALRRLRAAVEGR